MIFRKQYIGQTGSGTREICINEAIDLQEKLGSKIIILSSDKSLHSRFSTKHNLLEDKIIFYNLEEDDEKLFFIHGSKDIIYLFDNIEYASTLNSFIYDYFEYALISGFNILISSQEKMKNEKLLIQINSQTNTIVEKENSVIIDFSFSLNTKIHVNIFKNLPFRYIEDLIFPYMQNKIKNLHLRKTNYDLNSALECLEILDDKIIFTLDNEPTIAFGFFRKSKSIEFLPLETSRLQEENISSIKENIEEIKNEMPYMSKLLKIEVEIELQEKTLDIEAQQIKINQNNEFETEFLLRSELNKKVL